MKNREQLIIDAGCVISEYVKDHHKGFDLFYADGVFFCADSCPAEQMISFLRHFSIYQAEKGLTGSQWLRLGKKAVKLLKELT